MTLTKGADPTVYTRLRREDWLAIQRYMSEPMRAATFKDRKGGKEARTLPDGRRVLCGHGKLRHPIRVRKVAPEPAFGADPACGEENLPPEKMGRHEQAAHIRALNAQRRAKFHSRGEELLSKVIESRQKGDFKKSLTFFSHIKSWSVRPILEKYGKLGVERLADATPKATGKTAASWSYEIKMDKSGATLCWKNSNIVDGVPIAVILQYGTRHKKRGLCAGGVDYINPALAPIFFCSGR